MASAASAQIVRGAAQDFSLVNRTGYPIASIRVTETGSPEWGNDVMGRDTLQPGEQVDISFERGTQGCRWDVEVTYLDTTEAIWRSLNICDITRIALFWDRTTRETIARAD